MRFGRLEESSSSFSRKVVMGSVDGQTECLAESIAERRESKANFSPQPAQLCMVGAPVVLLVQQTATSSPEVLVLNPSVLLRLEFWWHILNCYSGFPSVHGSGLTQGSKALF